MKDLYERAMEIAKDIPEERFCEYYARYANELAIERDGDNWEKQEFLHEVTRVLEYMIVFKHMYDNGYYRDEIEPHPRWELDIKEW